jgi:superfamily II DNA or RNA helicase
MAKVRYMAKKRYDVVVPSDYKIKPAELDAAQILARHYMTTVTVLSPSKAYKEKTADFIIKGESYELKSPITKNVGSIEKMIRSGAKQSNNVVVDMRKSKITEKRMIKLCNDRLENIKKLRKIVLIVNNKKILEYSK